MGKKSRARGDGACRSQSAPKVNPSAREGTTSHYCSSRKCLAPTTQGWLCLQALLSPLCLHRSLEVFSEPESIVPESTALMRILLRHCSRVSGVSFRRESLFHPLFKKTW